MLTVFWVLFYELIVLIVHLNYGEFGVLVACNMTFENGNLTWHFDNCEWQSRTQQSAGRRQNNMGGVNSPPFQTKTNSWTLVSDCPQYPTLPHNGYARGYECGRNQAPQMKRLCLQKAFCASGLVNASAIWSSVLMGKTLMSPSRTYSRKWW